MSTTTPNLGLVKPELTDVADITAMNPNWDKIDETFDNFEQTNHIKSYTSLEQFGLSDDDMSDTDFAANMDLIVDALHGSAADVRLILQTGTTSINPNFHASVAAKLATDTVIPFDPALHAGWVSITFHGDKWRPTVVQTNLETANYYGNVWACIFNKGANGNTITPFTVVQTPEALMPSDYVTESEMMKVVNGITASDVGALPYYNSLESLGLSSPTNIADVFNAMPDGSEFVFSNDSSMVIADVPISYSLVVVKKQSMYGEVTATAVTTDGSNKDVYKASLFGNGVMTDWWEVGDFKSDGSVPMSGDLTTSGNVDVQIGYGRLTASASASQIEARDVSTNGANNRRMLILYNPTGKSATKNALTLASIKDGVTEGSYNIFGEHNKPSGSYTGNGSATERVIDVGGIGHSILVWSSTNTTIALVTNNAGALCKTETTVKALKNSAVGMSDGSSSAKLNLVTDDVTLNANGVTYYYRLL